jgi:DedD protein
MDSAMRDLEQIREKDEGEGRPVALVGLLIGVTVVLVLALGMVVGAWSEDEEAIAADDPLARLDRASGLAAVAEPETPVELPEVDPSTLTFPEALAPAEEERPEVAVALAAAAAELAHPEPVEPALPEIPASLPAAIAAGSGRDALARTATRDPLIAEALPQPAPQRAVAAGRDGEYTIQVISYDSPEGADAFADALRARGHRAFVMRAAVEGRGTMYRVRIGPFETQAEAQTYRREFEETERMNTLLVRRRTEES